MDKTWQSIAGFPIWQLAAVSVGIGLSTLIVGGLSVELTIRILWFLEDRK